MAPDEQRRIAAEGGRASHQSGRGHQWDPAAARVAGRKGGEARAQRTQQQGKAGSGGGNAGATGSGSSGGGRGGNSGGGL